MSFGLLATFRSRDARLAWPALLVLFALGALLGAVARAEAAAPDHVERCLDGAGLTIDGTPLHRGGEDAAACAAACLASPPLVAGPTAPFAVSAGRLAPPAALRLTPDRDEASPGGIDGGDSARGPPRPI